MRRALVWAGNCFFFRMCDAGQLNTHHVLEVTLFNLSEICLWPWLLGIEGQNSQELPCGLLEISLRESPLAQLHMGGDPLLN